MQRAADGEGGKARGIAAFGNGLHRPTDDGSRKQKRVGEHHDGSFEVYMAHKIQKLRMQNDRFIGSSFHGAITEAESISTNMSTNQDGDDAGDNSAPAVCASDSTLFSGVHVYVDGYTNPSKEEIRSLMLLHGGGFEHYQTPQMTHIVATHLATSKLLQLKKMRRPTPVVHPDWIVKSIAAKRLLPITPFLYRAFGDPTQSSMSGSLSGSMSATAKSPASTPGEVSKPMDIDDHETHRQSDDQIDRRKKDGGDDAEDDIFSDSDGGGSDDHMLMERAGPAGPHGIVPPPNEQEQSTAASSSSSSAMIRTNSTRDGPAFVRHFFAKSRLHHIGSWRTTFQQRAGEFLSKYKGKPFARAPPSSSDRVILHVDMDCFFVAVAVRDKPKYQNLPVAIAHSDNAGSSEISSCNYLARARGLRAGIFMQTAKELCPELIVLPYDFAAIEMCSFAIYDIFFSRTPYVQAMSCDEAYLEFGKGADGIAIAKEIRAAVFEATRCTASVGVSYSILLAKLATRQAKPDGLFHIANPEAAEPFISSLKVRDLPGVGHRMGAKMQELGLEDVVQLRSLSKNELETCFGKSAGDMLHKYARGIDPRPLSIESNMMRKSVSAVINFGIRFQTWQDTTAFVMALAEELSARLKALKVRTKCITLLVKKRKADAPVEPAKFMGMGRCDSFSKSQLLTEPSDSELVLGKLAIGLLRQFAFPNHELRGVGLQATKLVSMVKPVDPRSGQAFRAWLADAERKDDAPSRRRSDDVENATIMTTPVLQSNGEDSEVEVEEVRQHSAERMSQISMSVLDELPPSIRAEVLASMRHQQGDKGIIRNSAAATASRSTASSTSALPPRAKAKQKLTLPDQKQPSARSLFDDNTAGTVAVNALNDIRLSQVDEEVYHSLPMSIRREVDAYTRKKAKDPHASVAMLAKRNEMRQAKQLQQQHGAPVTATVPNKEDLQRIEDLFECLLVALALVDGDASSLSMSQMEMTLTATRSAFDAVYSRILVEIESRALDEALRMLRFVRRKCATRLAVHAMPDPIDTSVRAGFNQVLLQVNAELRLHYRASFPSRLVAPL